MIYLADVQARLEAEVELLAGRIDGAARFGQLMETGQAPQNTPAAFVLPGPITGGKAEAMTGLTVQEIREGVSVVLFVRTTDDVRGERGVAGLTPIARAVAEAIVGWAPEDATGVFTLDRAELVGSSAGTLVYELTFAIDDQLRIAA